jgi:hypothetical protein
VQYPTPQNARTSPRRNRSLGCAGLSANVRTKGQVHRAPVRIRPSIDRPCANVDEIRPSSLSDKLAGTPSRPPCTRLPSSCS